MNGEVVDPTGVSDPAPYPGLIIEEMMESASEAGEARDSKSERVSHLPLLDFGVLPDFLKMRSKFTSAFVSFDMLFVVDRTVFERERRNGINAINIILKLN